MPLGGAVTVPSPLLRVLVPLEGKPWGGKYVLTPPREKSRSVAQLILVMAVHWSKLMSSSVAMADTEEMPMRSGLVSGQIS